MSKEYKRSSSSRLNDCVIRRPSNKAVKLVRIYQPTYQLNPRKKFDVEKIQKLLRELVDPELEEVEYSDKLIPDICVNLAQTIRNAIKEENYDRYRIIVAVNIGQRRQQSIHVFHSFLWDYERDRFATYNYENCHIFANVVVYGIYLD
ncbi:hypothetical protein K1T71_010343 [Dendrolimus kikuchii]|uniref:Uncharacterized protein n=1 Tax=Dendrolimus kikuchii TaxID=765133 RepID=A0ACC1CRH7_9NEOP|nr:hypothetical protein K1T71_010343 [Dendrolimus kikuchii]